MKKASKLRSKLPGQRGLGVVPFLGSEDKRRGDRSNRTEGVISKLRRSWRSKDLSSRD